MTKWHYFSIFALSTLLVFILRQAPPKLLVGVPEPDGKIYPSSYLVNTKITQYDALGQISHILMANKIRYYGSQDSTMENIALFDQPKFVFHNNNTEQDAPWKAISDQSSSNNKSDEFLLSGNVVLSQEIDDENFSIITTSQLLIKPKQQYAETDKPAMIKNKSGTTTSVGLKISLDHGTVEFLSKVRSQYVLH
ncbi:LPS export ABC transporter periplasmic protein LptC [Candidatus Endobugula sertula]|uniref:LPS export ABC transporter periplasmic protein LptC n=1 Tax=Candidatus Endobugula sertula TaxID=62101 RepID=A0A1D2QQM7_9GAMM|nr:LPS export ABC transporter periplasmic protein LptC [Candidatus Endobugula sertula]